MSRGNRVTPVRLTADLIGRIEAAIESANARRKGEPYTLSSFIRAAIEEKLAHMERSRGRKGKGKGKGIESNAADQADGDQAGDQAS